MKGGTIIKFVKANWLLILIIIVGILVRSYEFGKIPSGLNQDEANIAYDAYATYHYGIDRNGFHNPVHFVGWGCGENALQGYISIPFMILFGLNVYSARFINLLLGVITLFVFFFFVKMLSDKDTAIVATFLLAICPWHIMLSRWGHAENLFPFFFLLGALFLIISLRKQYYLLLSFFFFAVALYGHYVAFFMVPTFVAIASAYLIFHKKFKVRVFILSWVIFLIVSLPIFLFILINLTNANSIETPFFSIPEVTVARWKHASSFSNNFFDDSIKNLNNLMNVLVSQNDGLIYNQLPPYGFLYQLSLPLAILGLLIILTKKLKITTFDKHFFVLLWFFLSIILGMLTSANGNRINIIFFPIIFFVANGLIFVRDKIHRHLFSILIIFYVILFVSFANTYFTTYPEKIGPKFFESFGDAINYASNNTNKSICITGQVNMPYIFVLFYQKVDPRVFYKSVKYADPGAEFQHVISFDRYYFYFDRCKNNENIGAFIFHNSEEKEFNKTDFDITKFKYYSVAIKKGK